MLYGNVTATSRSLTDHGSEYLGPWVYRYATLQPSVKRKPLDSHKGSSEKKLSSYNSSVILSKYSIPG